MDFKIGTGPAGGPGEDLKNRLQWDLIFDSEINYLDATKSLSNLNTRIVNKNSRARQLTRGPARPFRGSFWGSFWGSFLGSFLTHFLTTFLTSKTVSFLPLKIESKNEHFLKTFFSGPRAGPPKKPSLSNRRIGTRNTDSHMIPIIFVHSKKRLVHPRDTPQKPRAKIKIFFQKMGETDGPFFHVFSQKITKKIDFFDRFSGPQKMGQNPGICRGSRRTSFFHFFSLIFNKFNKYKLL